MAAITASGLGSGVDINGLVSQIIAAERAPVSSRLDRREGQLQARLSAFGTLKSSISSFQTSLASLQTVSTFQNKSVSSGDTDVLTASVSSAVAAGTYDISITQRAESHKLSTDPTKVAHQFTNIGDSVGTGTLTFKFGTTTTGPYGFTQDADKATQTVTITDGSLAGIRDAVNDAGIGVTASVIFDGSYQRLVFTANTGEKNSVEITVDDDDLDDTDDSGLSILAYETNAQNLAQNEAAQDASFSLSGVSISSESNTVTTAIEGMTINLLADTGTTSLTVSEDTGTINTNISSFVAKYNSLMGTINDLSSYDSETNQAGLLNGDGVLRNITTQIRRTISNPISGLTGSATILADIGITTSSTDGTLVLDNTKLNTAMNNNLDDVIGLFSAIGTPSDSLIEYVSSTDLTQVANHAVNITQLATQGDAVGSVAANLTITEGSNDAITLSVDGVATTITLSAGTYASASALVTEVQARINGASELSGLGVSVSESSGVLTITSNSYGSDSKVNLSGGNGRNDLVGTSPTNTDGVDVAGTIGGYEAIGEGRYLTGTSGASGLEIKVTGVATGDRGTVAFTRGYAQQLDDQLSELLSSDGIFSSTTDGLGNSIEGIGLEREALDRRIATIEERVRSQFIAMDLLVAKLRGTSDFLGQQLDSLPEIGILQR